MPRIALEWDTLKAAYPRRPLTGPLKAFMDQTPGTPCCVQMSHALNIAGCRLGPQSNRRRASRIASPAGTFHYFLAVDEMNWLLQLTYGAGEEISKDENGRRRTRRQMLELLDGRTGILVFSNLRYGAHIELWDQTHMHQRDMSLDLFDQPKVLFWDVMITAEA